MLLLGLPGEIYVNSLKEQLNKETNKAVQGQIIRSRVAFMKRMRNCPNVLNLEKNNYEKKYIRQLRSDNYYQKL